MTADWPTGWRWFQWVVKFDGVWARSIVGRFCRFFVWIVTDHGGRGEQEKEEEIYCPVCHGEEEARGGGRLIGKK